MKRGSIASLLLVTAVSANASEYQRCYNAGNTIEVNACLSDVLKKEDAKLNWTYRHVLGALKQSAASGSDAYADARVGLIKAQKLWIQYRDVDCGAVYEAWREGSIRGTKQVVCEIEKTMHRTKELAREWINAK